MDTHIASAGTDFFAHKVTYRCELSQKVQYFRYWRISLWTEVAAIGPTLYYVYPIQFNFPNQKLAVLTTKKH